MALDRDGTFVDTILSGWNGGLTPNWASATFKLALYTSTLTPNFSQAGPVYNVAPLNTGEVSGPGYTPGGVTLTQTIAESITAPGTIKFTAASVSWTSASFTTHGGLLYLSNMSNRAFQVRCFGADYTVQDGTFTITWHANGIWSIPLVGSVIG